MNTNRTAPPTVPPKPGETTPTHVDVDPAPGHEEILEGDEINDEEDDSEEIEGLDEDEEDEDLGSEDDEVEDD